MSDAGTVRRCFEVFRRGCDMLVSVNRSWEMLMRGNCLTVDLNDCYDSAGGMSRIRPNRYSVRTGIFTRFILHAAIFGAIAMA